MKYSVVLLTLAFSLALVIPGNAEASRGSKKLGVIAGLITNPFPSVYGFGLAYNLASFLRLGGNIGFTEATTTSGLSTTTISATTYSGEAKLMIPSLSFSPSASIGYSYVNMTLTGATQEVSSLPGYTSSGGEIYLGAGIDFQSGVGFTFGVDYKFILSGGGGLPGVYVGWFF